MDHNPGIGKTLVAADHNTIIWKRAKASRSFVARFRSRGLCLDELGQRVMPDLAPFFRVIAPDIAGFGYTEFKSDSKYDIKLWVKT